MTSHPLTIALMLESDGLGGAEAVLLQLALELRRRGHTVHPIGPEGGQGWLGQELRAQGLAPQGFRLRRAIDPLCVRRLARLIRHLRVDVMHGHEFDGAVYGTAAARLTGRPSVTTIHGKVSSLMASWKRRLALRWAFGRSDAVVAVSRATKEQLDSDLRLRPDIVSVIRNGVCPRPGDPAAVRRELGIASGETLILAVGNLLPLKGHILLLEALRRLSRSDASSVPWHLVIAAGWGGPERPRLESFVAEHRLADRVRILTNRSDIPDLQAAADVFVMPSLSEGFPLAIIEAMLAGTPVVASATGGIPEAIVSEEHGLLVPPGDTGALAVALRRMLTEPGLRERLSSRARPRALREFSVEAMTTAYEALYLESAHRSATRTRRVRR